jgi:4-diphosphocytidyl-2-C-methyl-D-erythritol kinase
LAASLGSDVPFFLDGPCAVAEGRGEELRRVEVREDIDRLGLLLVFPDVKISTGDAYARLDEWYALRPEEEIRSSLSRRSIEEQYRSGDPGRWEFYNSFTPVLVHSYPVYGELFSLMEEAGAAFSEITGSGSTLFSLFERVEALDDAHERVLSRGIEARKVKMLASCPEAVYNTL